MVIIFLDIAVCVWIIFLGGSYHLVGFMDNFYPGINESQVKFWAWIILLTAPIYYFLL